ncbi:MAG: signal peptidase I [Clostridia bacterium]|nr:signal peptidase I [Clostridia bacterium]
MKKMTKQQIINICIDVLCAVLCIVLLYSAISLLANRYVSWFGKLRLGVESDSMTTLDGQVAKEFSFDRGDLIVIDICNDNEISQLQEGDVITFWGAVDGVEAMITHRITSIRYSEDNTIDAFQTQGDKALGTNTYENVTPDKVIGKVVKVVVGGGGFALFRSSQLGRFILTVIPSVLIVAYFAVLFVVTLRKSRTDKQSAEMDDMRRQLVELQTKVAQQNAQSQPNEEEHTAQQEDKE